MKLIHRIAPLIVVTLLAAVAPPGGLAASAANTAAAAVTTADLRSVAFVTASTGFAAAENGTILKTTDGGESWTQVRSPDSYAFRGISFWSTTSGVAVDYSGKVAHTTDGGATWSNINFSPYVSMDGGGIGEVARTHNDVACLWGGIAAITAAGDDAPADEIWTGATAMRMTGNLKWWQNPVAATKPHRWYNVADLTFYDVGNGEFLDVEYADATTVWASGIDNWPLDPTNNPEKYPLFKSVDGGVTYQKVSGFGNANLRLEGVAFSGTSSGIVVGQLVGGTRVVYRTSNGGTAWTAATTLPGGAALNAVDMASPTNGWAVSQDGGIIRTTDGGATWSACTITGGNAYPLYDVTFVSGTTTGWAVGASGTVLITTDGATWRQPSPPSPVDTTPPAAPTGLAATATGSTTIGLSWSASTDPSGIAKYTVYTQAGAKVADVTGTSSYSVTGLTPSTAYSYQVTATDGAGNQSAKSTAGGATTLALPDTTPPAAPTGLTATATGSTTIGLSWSASADPSGIAKYTVYTQAGAKVADVTGATSYSVTGLTPSTAYSYQVTATDGAGNQSAKSTAAGATTQAAPVAPPIPVYRFYNTSRGTHFYTPSEDERAMIKTKWPLIFVDEGVAYSVNPANNNQPLYRFYNTNSGSHFYTASPSEADNVKRTWPHIFNYEGETYPVSAVSAPGKIAVYRFYHLGNGSHFFTSNAGEAEMVRATWPHVYRYEGPVFWLGQ